MVSYREYRRGDYIEDRRMIYPEELYISCPCLLEDMKEFILSSVNRGITMHISIGGILNIIGHNILMESNISTIYDAVYYELFHTLPEDLIGRIHESDFDIYIDKWFRLLLIYFYQREPFSKFYIPVSTLDSYSTIVFERVNPEDYGN